MKKNKLSWLAVLALVILTLLLAACGEDQTPTNTSVAGVTTAVPTATSTPKPTTTTPPVAPSTAVSVTASATGTNNGVPVKSILRKSGDKFHLRTSNGNTDEVLTVVGIKPPSFSGGKEPLYAVQKGQTLYEIVDSQNNNYFSAQIQPDGVTLKITVPEQDTLETVNGDTPMLTVSGIAFFKGTVNLGGPISRDTRVTIPKESELSLTFANTSYSVQGKSYILPKSLTVKVSKKDLPVDSELKLSFLSITFKRPDNGLETAYIIGPIIAVDANSFTVLLIQNITKAEVK
jgi:hypothetical protein